MQAYIHMEIELKFANIGINLYDLRGSKTSEGFMTLEWELVNAMAIIDIIEEMIRIEYPYQDRNAVYRFIRSSRFPVGAS